MATQVVALKPTGYSGSKSAGEIFEMLDQDVEAFVRDGLVARYKSVEAQSADIELSEGLSQEEVLDKLAEAWQVDQSPDEYLADFPDGPMAELAKRIIEARAALES